MLSLKQFLGITGVALVLGVTIPVVAQTPPASTYKPGYWQPIARVNPKNLVTVTLINQTKFPLNYNFLDEKGEKTLAVGASRQLKVASLPIDIAIYDASPQASAGDDTKLGYKTAVTKNVVSVTVVPTTGYGFNVFNIAKTGAIYAY